MLVGMMGSGKTTIGHLLARSTGWPYVDNDELVRRDSGRTARQLLADGGEDRLRAAESGAFGLGLSLPPPVILGVAAGTVLDPENRERMRDGGVVVWLRASAETLTRRAGGAAHRPFIDRGGPDWMRHTAAEREPLYEAVADVTVDTGHAAPDESVRVIRDYLASIGACTDAAPR